MLSPMSRRKSSLSYQTLREQASPRHSGTGKRSAQTYSLTPRFRRRDRLQTQDRKSRLMARMWIRNRRVSFLPTDCRDDGNRSAPAAALGGRANPRRGNLAVAIAEEAAAFPSTEPTL